MSITFTRIDPLGQGRTALIDFMTGNEFPFHGNTRPSVADVDDAIRSGKYRDHDNDSFWIEHDAHGRIGFFRFEDLSDDTPVFDMRLSAASRGSGFGVDVLRAATDYLFTSLPEVRRFEGQTREDNIAMRKTFLRAGWVKEAHYREGWPVEDGAPVASVAYAVLRRDWESGQTTPLTWDDLVD